MIANQTGVNRLLGQLAGLALVYFTFKLINRHLEKQDPKFRANANERGRTIGEGAERRNTDR